MYSVPKMVSIHRVSVTKCVGHSKQHTVDDLHDRVLADNYYCKEEQHAGHRLDFKGKCRDNQVAFSLCSIFSQSQLQLLLLKRQ